jgi:GH25 family lysozyme M1 (1,4-beta-N-acetylmuramidase)
MLKKIIPLTVSAAIISGCTSVVYADETEVQQNFVISGIYGDVTGDNIVDLKDELTLTRYLVEGNGSEEPENIRCIDLNNDSRISITDLAILRHELMGDMSFPIGTPVYEPEDLSEGINGIDVSKWQGTDIDWDKVKQSGIEFVMIKAGEGIEEEVNFRRNIEGAVNAGIKCGVYWFANASTTEEAESEAMACLKTISGNCLEYPVAYDFEYRTLENNPADGNRTLMTDIAATFLESIQKSGYYPILYSNTDFLDNYFYADRLAKFDLWYAGYNVENPDRDCFIWQKSCTGGIDGINTYVDIDVSYKDYSAIIKRYHWNGF